VREQKCPSCGNVMDFITIGKDAMDDIIIKCPKCLRITVVESEDTQARHEGVSDPS
jgi:phage FluMu protein Com